MNGGIFLVYQTLSLLHNTFVLIISIKNTFKLDLSHEMP